MAAKRLRPRDTLAINLRELLAAHEMSGPELARRAKVDIKTVNNMVNGRYDPRPEKVDQVAEVFGMLGWQLLVSDLPMSLLRKDGRLADLIRNYGSASDDGRESITRVAEMAARNNKG